MYYKAIIQKFKSYRKTHPHLANLWIAYLGLKKRHWCNERDIAEQAQHVLNSFEQGYTDLNKNDILSILLYKQVMI